MSEPRKMQTDEIMTALHLSEKHPVLVYVDHLTAIEWAFLQTMLVNAGYTYSRGKIDGKRYIQVDWSGFG